MAVSWHKQLVKRALFAVTPRLAAAVMSARARAHSHDVLRGWGNRRVVDEIVARYGPCVQRGPFAGLVLTPMTFAEQVGPHLLGVYEHELDGAWRVALQGTYARVVDVGAKFGYYAVGLARKFPAASVTAFDTDWWARKALREMIAANAVSNVVVRGYCRAADLVGAAGDPAFVLSDCEGYEAVLFESPATIDALRSATLLIETHDAAVPGVTSRLRAAFASTHVVREYGESASPRTMTITCPLDFLTPSERQLALQEVRGPQRWLLCLPTSGDNSHLRLIPTQSA